MAVFELEAVLGLNTSQFEKGTKGALAKVQKLGNGIKTGLKTAAVVAGGAIAAVGAATVTIGKQALSSYAEYEQLVGGVETLFKDASGTVLDFAQNAFKTAGMSANDYMETVTSFSASLIQSLKGDTGKAAEYANMAITDMSDNSNKMGTDISSLQAAYSGFSKQNYTMLDNLKLGYGGTKSEMDRLIKDAMKLDKGFKVAEKTTGKGKKANKELAYSYADIVQAIHIVQDNMGITGTTAKEASTTISGSVSSMKASWQNLLTGIADDNADIGALVDTFVESALTAADNILPRIATIMDGIGTLINEALPKILPIIVNIITENMPAIIEAGFQILIALITGIISALPQLIDALPQIWEAIKNAFKQNAPAMAEAGTNLLNMLIEGVKNLLSKAKEAVSAKLAEWSEAANTALINMGEAFNAGFIELAGKVAGWVSDNIITPMKNAIAGMVDVGKQVVNNLLSGIQSKWNSLKSWVSSAWAGIKKLFTVSNSDVQMPTGGGVGGGHAIGLDYVPYNGYQALLHRGEAVLTAREADQWRRGSASGYDPTVGAILEVLQEIAQNGLKADVDGRSLYRAVQTENAKRTRATNYNGLVGA